LNLLEKLKLPDLLKLKKPKLPFLNQIKIQLFEMLKQGILKFERLVKPQRLHEKLFMLKKLELLVLTLPKPLLIPKKTPRRDAVGAARRID
jgi:hypothetical protein